MLCVGCPRDLGVGGPSLTNGSEGGDENRRCLTMPVYSFGPADSAQQWVRPLWVTACPQPRESGVNAGWDIESGKQGRLVAQSPEHVCPKRCAVVTPALERSTLVQGAPCPMCAPAAPADRGGKVAAGSPTGCGGGRRRPEPLLCPGVKVPGVGCLHVMVH